MQQIVANFVRISKDFGLSTRSRFMLKIGRSSEAALKAVKSLFMESFKNKALLLSGGLSSFILL